MEKLDWASGVLLHNTLGRGGASPSPCTPPEQGVSLPMHHDEEPGPVPATLPNRAPVGCAATVSVASPIRSLAPDTPRQAVAPGPTTKGGPPLDT